MIHNPEALAVTAVILLVIAPLAYAAYRYETSYTARHRNRTGIRHWSTVDPRSVVTHELAHVGVTLDSAPLATLLPPIDPTTDLLTSAEQAGVELAEELTLCADFHAALDQALTIFHTGIEPALATLERWAEEGFTAVPAALEMSTGFILPIRPNRPTQRRVAYALLAS